MDNLHLILHEAWNRIGKRVRADRVQALKRSRRRFMKSLTTPMRGWCLVIRASDTRISPMKAIIDLPDDVTLPAAAMDDPIDWALTHGMRHTVTLTGKLIRELTKPVNIPYPGVTYHEAARMLGREYQTLHNWVKHGVLKVEHYREHWFPEYTKRSKGGR